MPKNVDIQYPSLPEILKKKLVIGDWEQIRALDGHEKEIERLKEQERKIKAGILTKYTVTVEFEGSHTMKVLAASAKEAEDIAEDMFDLSMVDDCDVTGTYCEESDEED